MFSFIYEAIGNIFGEEQIGEIYGDPLDFKSGLFLDCGISWIHVRQGIY